MKKNKGITLIILVIIIIIMLFLAAITIGLVFNERLINYAKEAKANTQNQIESERVIANGIVNEKTIDEWVNEGNGETRVVTGWTLVQTVPTDWDEDKVIAITDGTNIVPIPKGYVVSNEEEENALEEGLVIYEMTEEQKTEIDWTNASEVETVRKTFNQYVWIPVENPSNMYGTDLSGNKLGKLYDFDGQGTTTALNWTETNAENKIMSWTSGTGSNREPVRLSADNSKNIIGWTVMLYQNEFNEMVASVEKYGGFYIGRYETGGYDKSVAVIKAGEGTNSINNTAWSKMYNKTKTLSKTIEGEEISKVSIIWGCQYDQMIMFANCAIETTPSKDMSLIESGAVSTDCYKNIYDLCGNVLDTTMEAYNTDRRISRGGGYNFSAPEGSRYKYSGPSYISIAIGSRATLYIAP